MSASNNGLIKNWTKILEKTITPPQPPNHLLFAVHWEPDRSWTQTDVNKPVYKKLNLINFQVYTQEVISKNVSSSSVSNPVGDIVHQSKTAIHVELY